MEWDKKKEYDEHVAPLFNELYKRCKELGLPLHVSVQHGRTKETNNFATASIVQTKVLPAIEMLAHRVIDEEPIEKLIKPEVLAALGLSRLMMEVGGLRKGTFKA